MFFAKLRPLINIADQGVLSLGSLTFSILIARHVSSLSFGVFSLIFATNLIVLGFQRGLIGDVLIIRYGKESSHTFIGGAVFASCAYAGLVSALLLILSVLLDHRMAVVFAAYAFATIVLCLQDTLRSAFFALRQPSGALISDIGMTVGQIAAILALSAKVDCIGETTFLVLAMAAWGTAAAVAAALMMWQLRAMIELAAWRAWRDRNLALGGRMGLDFLSYSATQQGAAFIVAWIMGFAAAGGFRGAQTLIGPIGVLSSGLGTALLPRAAAAANKPDVLRRLCIAAGVLLMAASFTTGAAIWFLPPRIGAELLGETWAATTKVAVPIAVAYGFNGMGFAASIGLRAREKAGKGLKVRFITLPLTLSLVPLATLQYGIQGAALAMMLTSMVGAIIWWCFFVRDLKEDSAHG